MSKTVFDYIKETSNKKENSESFYVKARQIFFELIYTIIKSNLPSTNTEIIFSIIELAECLSFPFHSKYENLFTKGDTESYNKKLFQITSPFFSYFTLQPFFDSLTVSFSILFFFFIFILFFTIFFSILVSQFFLNSQVCISICKYFLSLISSLFYIPMTIIFLTPYYFASTLYRDILLVIGVLSSVILLIVGVCIKLVMYDKKEKWSSINDFYLIIGKTILSFLYIYVTDEYLLIVITVLIAIFLYYNYIATRTIKQMYIQILHVILYSFFLWGSTVTIVVKILNSSLDLSFNGGIMMFLMGSIIIVGKRIFFANTEEIKILLKSIDKTENSVEALLHLITVENLVIEKENSKSRKTDIFLEGYIKSYEDKCIIPNCPLKKYISSTYAKKKYYEEKNTILIYLYQHIEILYKNAFNKYPRCLKLKLSYIQFLYEIMYKRQQALSELNELGGSQDISSFEDIFMIYKLKNDIENNEDTNNKEGGANSGYSASYTND